LEFPEGLGDLGKNIFHGGGMDIFWNYTLMAKFILGTNFSMLNLY